VAAAEKLLPKEDLNFKALEATEGFTPADLKRTAIAVNDLWLRGINTIIVKNNEWK